MKETEKKTERFINRYAMIRSGERVLAAVSGGADSMCMLYLLLECGKSMGFTVAAAHYEHGIRGEESMRDCAFVEALCAEAGIELAVEHGHVPDFAAERGMGIEEAARTLRYAFLKRAAEQLRCEKIATAHNMDDNAETVLFHLARGTGTAGLTGIPPVRGNIIRPVLNLSRNEIEEYLQKRNITYMVDSTNADDTYARNRIRHAVLPELKRISSCATEAIFRTTELLRADEACLNGMAQEFIERIAENGAAKSADGVSVRDIGSAGTESTGKIIPIKELAELPAAVAARVIRNLWPVNLSMEQVNAVLALPDTKERKHLDLPGGSAELDRGKLFLLPGKNYRRTELRDGLPAAEQKRDFLLHPEATVYIPDRKLRITCEECIAGGDVHDLLNTFVLKCGEIYGPLRCTGRMPGDRLRVRGRNCTKTLKSLFLEADMTQQEREERLVFRDDHGVLAVEGLAVAERSVPKPGDTALRIVIERNIEE